MTITAPRPTPNSGVYRPQEDSRLLLEVLTKTVAVAGRSVVDLGTGSGFLAIEAARLGAGAVTAWDICPLAVRHSRDGAAAAGVVVDVRLGSWTEAARCGGFDVVLANPPYVPTDPEVSALVDGPAQAWDAGPDGRLVLDPLCAAAPGLLLPGGTLLLVQSELAGVAPSLDALRRAGLVADIVARQWIPFGPVLTSRTDWLERTGRSSIGRRREELVVIRADRE